MINEKMKEKLVAALEHEYLEHDQKGNPSNNLELLSKFG